MTQFEMLYSKLLTTPEELAGRFMPGWRVGMDCATSETPAIIAALEKSALKRGLRDIRVQTMLDVHPFGFYTDPAFQGVITGEAWFAGKGARKALSAGLADFRPAYYRDMPGRIRAFCHYDTSCFSTAPMDSDGYFSLGLVSSYSEAMMEKSDRIFLEVNSFQPRAVNGAKVHISQVDALVENNVPLPVMAPSAPDPVSLIIGQIIAGRIEDGSCIQLGIGAIPDAVGQALRDKHDLGLHTEMFTDSMVDLIECGAVNNSRKQLLPGKSVATFGYGTQRMYDFVSDEPDIMFLPVDYVNDPAIISRNDMVVSINTAVEVDLWGQVCAESVGTRYLSGTGGQVDFVRGACMSKNGKSFIALASTAKNGTTSKIRPELQTGAVVTTGKNDVDYIVTEYGIAHMRGESLSSRARQLIGIAHPDFRDELTFEAKKRGIMI